MGMFDDIQCKKELPLNDELRAAGIKLEDTSFQTKDLENCLLHYTILEDGRLVENVVEREYVHYTEEEKKSKDRKPWDLFKDVKITNEYDKFVEHHGVINFYTGIDYTDEESFWVEFNAYFIYGKLDKIELAKCEKQKSTKLYNKEWDEKRKLDDKKLLNRVKKTLRKLGWTFLWRKVSNFFYQLSNFFSKIRMFIIRYII